MEALAGTDGPVSGNACKAPFGHPVVPEEYSMKPPTHSSAIGVAG